jgi:hypothetical protein
MRHTLLASLTVLSVSLLGSTACTAQVVGPAIPADMTAACVAGAIPYTTDLRPAVAIDFVTYRTETATEILNYPTGTVPAAQLVVTDAGNKGQLCKSAADVPACETRFRAETALGATCGSSPIVRNNLDGIESEVAAPADAIPIQVAQSCKADYLAYTRASEVGVARRIEDSRAFLGSIDTPWEALYLVSRSGENMNCAAAIPPAYKAVAGGYEVQTGSSDRCGNALYRKRLFVAANGDTKVLSSEAYTSTCGQ